MRSEIGAAVRNAFIARDCGEDPLLLSLDYSQIELRILAHVSGDEELRRAFLAGEDVHRATASNVFKVAPEEVDVEMRRRAKVFNFGVLYGLTAFGLSQREGIPRDEAEEFIRAYFAAYPQVAHWRDAVVAEARERGYAETLTGRRRYIPELRSRNHNRRLGAERIAINMPIQGAAADIIKIAMNRIDTELVAHRASGRPGAHGAAGPRRTALRTAARGTRQRARDRLPPHAGRPALRAAGAGREVRPLVGRDGRDGVSCRPPMPDA